jgi:hypothetical protein
MARAGVLNAAKRCFQRTREVAGARRRTRGSQRLGAGARGNSEIFVHPDAARAHARINDTNQVPVRGARARSGTTSRLTRAVCTRVGRVGADHSWASGRSVKWQATAVEGNYGAPSSQQFQGAVVAAIQRAVLNLGAIVASHAGANGRGRRRTDLGSTTVAATGRTHGSTAVSGNVASAVSSTSASAWQSVSRGKLLRSHGDRSTSALLLNADEGVLDALRHRSQGSAR